MIGTGNDTDIRITLGTSDVEIYLGDEKVYPNTPPVPDYSLMYFTTEGIYDSDNTVIELSNYTSAFEYSKDGVEWHSTGTSGTTFNLGLRLGEKAYWRCVNPNIDTTNGIGHFNGTHPFKVYGNIMSLVYGDDFEGQTSLSGKSNIFRNLFSNNQYLTDVENLVLPATTLANYCYQYMFSNCTNLTVAPQLPATTLASSCYYQMFRGCTNLTDAPTLSATTLANSCYYQMFQGCTSLTTAPDLPATTLANYCYQYMFSNCTSLVTAPELPATTLANYCYGYMFNGCTSLTTAPELPATTLASNCYGSMFYGCTNLTTAPVLPATILQLLCYQSMFNGCTKLNYIKAMFTTTPSSSYTGNWVNKVASSGTFVKNSAASWNVSGLNGIPTGWTVVTE